MGEAEKRDGRVGSCVPEGYGLAHGTGGASRLAMSIAELRQLPNDEKLRIIETLWADISADDASLVSPDWHVKELEQAEADLSSGKVKAVDWDAAKKELRERFN